MKGDFSRLTFDVSKHFSRVMMQQGRVQLDADWNEQTAILLHYIQTVAKDLIGEYGGPANNLGFEIKNNASIANNFLLGEGRYYVDGVLAENESPAVKILKIDANNTVITLATLTINDFELKPDQYLELYQSNSPDISELARITGIDTQKLELTVTPALTKPADSARRIVTYQTQQDYPLPSPTRFNTGDVFLVYLDIWERHITCLEDDDIREVALGGPDTATRTKLVWQIKVTDIHPDGKTKLKEVTPPPKGQKAWRSWIHDAKQNRWPLWKDQWQPANRGLLKARVQQDQKKATDPCTVSPESSYRGMENQLYRVEIHRMVNVANAEKKANTVIPWTFKWARDNGSTVTRIVVIDLAKSELTVTSTRGLEKNHWLELSNDDQELRGEPGCLVKIVAIDCDTVKFAIDSDDQSILTGSDAPTKARQWNSGEIQIIENNEDKWLKLEDGIEIQFQPSSANARPQQYRTGDYWLIPARVATGDVEWPGSPQNPKALPPHGIAHHYAPLAMIKIDVNSIDAEDLRNKIESLSQPT